MGKTISEIFREKTEKLIEERKVDLIKACKKEVFFSMLNEYKEYFPLMVVQNSEDQSYTLMHFIGTGIFQNEEHFFYDETQNLFCRINGSDGHIYRVEKTDKIDEINKALITLDRLCAYLHGYFDHKRGEKILVPEGFHVFRYRMCRIYGIGELKTVMCIEKADSFSDAVKKHILNLPTGDWIDYFRDFEIYINGKWNKMKHTNIGPVFVIDEIINGWFFLE